MNHQNVEEQNEDKISKEESAKIEQNTSSPNEPVPPTQQVVSPPKPTRKSRPQGKLVSAMINAFSNRKTLPKNPPEETLEERIPVHEITSTAVVQNQIKPEAKPNIKSEAIPEVKPEVTIVNQNENLNIEKINMLATVPTVTLVEPLDRSKSSSFSVPKPSAQFRSVKRPVIRTKAQKTASIEKPKSSEGPAMTYADIMAAKEARQSNTLNPSISNASTPVPSNPVQENLLSSVPTGSAQNEEFQVNMNSEVETEVETYGGNENTSDDAESIPISYQEPQESFKKSSRIPSSDLQTKTTKHQKMSDLPDSEESSISEVHQEELKKDLTNHSHIPSRSRKPLVKRPSISLDQIPEEKSEASVSEKKIVDKETSKKRRRRRSKGEARDGASMRSTSSMEERLASDEKLRKEFEEFVKKQKELEKEQKREKKKRKKEKKKTEEVKVTNIFDGMEQNFDVQTTSNSSGRFSQCFELVFL